MPIIPTSLSPIVSLHVPTISSSLPPTVSLLHVPIISTSLSPIIPMLYVPTISTSPSPIAPMLYVPTISTSLSPTAPLLYDYVPIIDLYLIASTDGSMSTEGSAPSFAPPVGICRPAVLSDAPYT